MPPKYPIDFFTSTRIFALQLTRIYIVHKYKIKWVNSTIMIIISSHRFNYNEDSKEIIY